MKIVTEGPALPARPEAAVTSHDVGEEDGVSVRLGHMGLIVQDVERALTFYRRLGLDIPPGVDRVQLPGGPQFFWDSVAFIERFDPHWVPPSGGRRVVLEFAFDTPEALDAKYAEMIAYGYEGYMAPFDTGFGPRYAVVKDPDENEVSLRWAP